MPENEEQTVDMRKGIFDLFDLEETPENRKTVRDSQIFKYIESQNPGTTPDNTQRKKEFIDGLHWQRSNWWEDIKGAIDTNALDTALGDLNQPIDFINEIIQNADDCNYPDGKDPGFIVVFKEQEIVIYYNEKGMTWSDIVALTSYGYSNKNDVSNDGTTFDKTTIGEKGIGFKFIFKVCDSVEIFSNGYRFILKKENLGFIPEWNNNPSQEYDKETPNYTIIVMHNTNEMDANGSKIDTNGLFTQLKDKYSANLCSNPVLFTKKLRNITAAFGNEIITCTRSGDLGMDSETDPKSDGNAETKTVKIFMECKEKKRSYNLCGISYPVQISKDAVKQRYGEDKDAYRRIFIFAAFDEAEKLQTDMKEIGGTMYSYLPTAEQLTVPLIIQLPVRLDKKRMHIFFDNNNNNKWNNEVLDDNALGAALQAFFDKIRDKINEAAYNKEDDKEDNFKQLWRLLPKEVKEGKPFGGKLFEKITKQYETVYNEAPCFYSLSGETLSVERLISREKARMLDSVLRGPKLDSKLSGLEKEYEEAYHNCCEISDWHIISYDEEKKGIIAPVDPPVDPEKKKILEKLIEEGFQDKLFNIWNDDKQSDYLPELNSWNEQPIFPAAVDNNETVAYKPLKNETWFADDDADKDKKLTSPENCFLHFYHCGVGDEKMKRSVNPIPSNPDGKETAVLEALADMAKGKTPEFSPTFEKLGQLAKWGFGVDDPLKVWNDDWEESEAEGLDISGTESTVDTPKQSYFAKIAAWCSYKENNDTDYNIDALILLTKAYRHNGFNDAGSGKIIDRKITLPPFSAWKPVLRNALNKLRFGISKNDEPSFVINEDNSSNSSVKEELKTNIISTYGLNKNIKFYSCNSCYSNDCNSNEKVPKFAAFLNTVVFFGNVEGVFDDPVKDFISHILDSDGQMPLILKATKPLTKNDKKLLKAITKISENRCKLLTQDSEKDEDVPNDPISELLQNVDDSKLRSGENCAHDFEVKPSGDTIVLRYTEKGFSARDFYCITHRHSTGNINQGDSIGHFGTGFRSVYTMFRRVEIRSCGYCCELEPYNEKSDRYNALLSTLPQALNGFYIHYLRLQPIPIFTEDAGQNDGKTTFTLYPKNKDEINEIIANFKKPERYVFLDRLGSYDKDDKGNRIFTSKVWEENGSKKFLSYEETLGIDITKYPDSKRKPAFTVTVRFGEKPKEPTPFYCGLPLKNPNSHLYCYVNVPAFVPDPSRKNIATNNANGSWNNTVKDAANKKICSVFGKYAEYYYSEEKPRDFLEPYQYLTSEFYNSNSDSMAELRIFPAENKAGKIELCSANDIKAAHAYILPKAIFEDTEIIDEEAIQKLRDYQTANDTPPIIYDIGVNKFLSSISSIRENIPSDVLFSAFYPGKKLYDGKKLQNKYYQLPDLPDNSGWISVNNIRGDKFGKYISADTINGCVKGLYGDEDLCRKMFDCFNSFDNQAKELLYNAADTIFDTEIEISNFRIMIDNYWIPVRINNRLVLLDRNRFYVRVKESITSEYAVECHDWTAEIPKYNILTSAEDFKKLFKQPNPEITEGCTKVFLKRTDKPIAVDWNSEYSPILRTYCKEYSAAAKGKLKELEKNGKTVLNSDDAPTTGLRFTFNSDSQLTLSSVRGLERKFKAHVDSDKVSWEELEKKCLIIQNSSYNGYAWQNVKEEDAEEEIRIVLFYKNDTTLPYVLQNIMSDLFGIEVILGEKSLEDDYMISILQNGIFSEAKDISELIPYYKDSKKKSPPTSDNDFYLIGTWEFQYKNPNNRRKFKRYKGYGITNNEKEKGKLPVCPVCGGQLLAHRRSCKIENVSVMPIDSADKENPKPLLVPVLMCSTCSDSMKYYSSVTLEAKDSACGSVFDAITNNPDNLLICFNSLKTKQSLRIPFKPTVYHRLLMLDMMNMLEKLPDSTEQINPDN